jgi:hypothetical protein
MSHRPEVSAPRDTPAHGDRPRSRVRTRRRRTPPSAYLIGVSLRLEFTTLTCGPNTGTRRFDQNARICTVPGLPGLDREAAQIGGYCLLGGRWNWLRWVMRRAGRLHRSSRARLPGSARSCRSQAAMARPISAPESSWRKWIRDDAPAQVLQGRQHRAPQARRGGVAVQQRDRPARHRASGGPGPARSAWPLATVTGSPHSSFPLPAPRW